RRRFPLSSGLLAKFPNLVDSLRVRSKRLLHSLRTPLPGNRVHPMDEIPSDRLPPLRTHDDFAAPESNRTTRPRSGVHIPPRSVARHNAALSEPLLTELDLLQFRKSWNNASNLPVNCHDTVVVNGVGHELDRVSGDLLDLVPDLLDAVLHTGRRVNSLRLHVVPGLDDVVTRAFSSRDALFPEIAELPPDVRNPPGHGLGDRVLHVGESLLDGSDHGVDS